MDRIEAIECPELTILEQFLHDDLPSQEADYVDAHIDSCTACQQLLDDLVDLESSNSLDRLLQRRAESLFGPRTHWLASVGDEARQSRREPIKIPDCIGGYRVVGELGRGAYGVVYHALDDALDRSVAIKVPHDEIIRSAGAIEIYLKEARALAALDHPNIVRVYEAKSTADGGCFAVSQFISGRSLAEILCEQTIPPAHAVNVLLPLVDALQHAHERGIIHRDVKPANILIDHTGKPYLADFGLAIKEDEIGRGPRTLGTPAYMSPEQARGVGHLVDGRTDIFSLGVVFYKMLTGKRPFLAKSAKQLREMVVNIDAPSVRQKDRTIPLELDRICAKSLARDPSQRYRSASDVSADLSAWLEKQAGGSTARLDPLGAAGRLVDDQQDLERVHQDNPIKTRPIGPVARLARRCRRRPLVPTMLLTLCLFTLSLLSIASPWSADRSNTIRVGIKPWVGFSPLVVAAEMQLLDEFELELVPIRNTTDARQRLRSRDLDAAPTLVDSHALARAERAPSKAILQLDVSKEADAVIAIESIREFGDLKGKRVAYVHNEAPHFLLLSLCDLYGVDPDDFTHEEVDTAKQAADMFMSGKVHAAVTYEPFVQEVLDNHPNARRLATAADDHGAIIDIMTVHEEYLRTDVDKIQQLITGWMEAVELLEAGDRKAIEIACRFLGEEGQPITAQEYAEMASGMDYGGRAENLTFFRTDTSGNSEFRRRFNQAQQRWDDHHQLHRKTDAADGDGSEVLLKMYER